MLIDEWLDPTSSEKFPHSVDKENKDPQVNNLWRMRELGPFSPSEISPLRTQETRKKRRKKSVFLEYMNMCLSVFALFLCFSFLLLLFFYCLFHPILFLFSIALFYCYSLDSCLFTSGRTKVYCKRIWGGSHRTWGRRTITRIYCMITSKFFSFFVYMCRGL